jgi:hypothetical protein
MKAASLFVAGLAVAILSHAPANADNNKCSSSSATISAVPCTKPKAANYAQCGDMLRKNGWEPATAWWWCSNQGFKS